MQNNFFLVSNLSIFDAFWFIWINSKCFLFTKTEMVCVFFCGEGVAVTRSLFLYLKFDIFGTRIGCITFNIIISQQCSRIFIHQLDRIADSIAQAEKSTAKICKREKKRTIQWHELKKEVVQQNQQKRIFMLF